MNLKISLVGVLCFFCSSAFSQDFQSFAEISEILKIDFVKIEDTLVKKGFVFEKTEGLLFRYKKNNSRIEFQITPKEITYFFTDRGFFLRINSELLSANFQLMNAEENITIQNKPVKSAYLAKDGESVYLWSFIDESTKKTMYGLRLRQDIIPQKTAPAEKKAKAAENPPAKAPAGLFKTTKPAKEKDTVQAAKREPSISDPKPYRFSFAIGGFTFHDPSYGPIPCPNLQFGFQKSTFTKKATREKMVSDIGHEIEFSYFAGMDYGWRSDPTQQYSTFVEYIDLKKYYLSVNQYINLDFKYLEFAIEGGPFLSYTRGVGKTGSAGFMTSGFHFGEHLQKGLGKTTKGHSRFVLGMGFDQYIAFKGGYIGSFGVSLGF